MKKKYKSALPLRVLLLGFQERVANYDVSQRGPGSISHPRKDTPRKRSRACVAGGVDVQERAMFPDAQGGWAGDFVRTFSLPTRTAP